MAEKASRRGAVNLGTILMILAFGVIGGFMVWLSDQAAAERALVIVEVKTRRRDAPPPEAGLTRAKHSRLVRLAARLQERREYRDMQIRFDAIAIVWPDGAKPDVRHYQDAFDSS